MVDNQPLEQFNFLGCQLSYHREVDISHKLEKFNYICDTIRSTLKNKTRIGFQIKYYKVMAVAAGLYGSEDWTLTKKDLSRIEAAEMRFL